MPARPNGGAERTSGPDPRLATKEDREGRLSAPKADLLDRISEAGSMLVYVMELLPDGGYHCLEFSGLAEVVGMVPTDLSPEEAFEAAVHPDDRPAYDAAYSDVGAGIPVELEYRLIGYDGQVRWVLDRMRPHLRPDGRTIVDGIVTDITESKHLADELATTRLRAFAAHNDVLTGLSTRLGLEERLETAMSAVDRAEGALAVLFLDLDRFKLVNDSYGHAAGDELLRGVAHRLRSAVRADDLIARQGGDEFLILMIDAHPSTTGSRRTEQRARSLAHRIRQALRPAFTVAGQPVHVTASIGISVYPDDATDAASLLKQADIALYAAKDAGRDRVRRYTPAANTAAAELSVTGRLRQAIESGRGLRLEYQPLVLLEDGRVEGVEALVRWDDPERGPVPPSMFLPIAERVGLIGPLSDWVVDEACRQAAGWLERGLDLYVSINLPPSHLDARGLRRLRASIERHGMPIDRVMLEVTESAVANDGWEHILPALLALRDGGVKLAIDDFGSGHSSLSRLSDDWVSVIKIDRSFVARLTESDHARALVTSILQLAQNLGIEPLAEGVEHEEQRRLLLELGCNRGQGFLFSRPVRAERVPSLPGLGRVAEARKPRRAASGARRPGIAARQG